MSDPKLSADPLEGKELTMVNTLLGVCYKPASEGDGPSIDRVIRLLALRRQYKQDSEDSWEGAPE